MLPYLPGMYTWCIYLPSCHWMLWLRYDSLSIDQIKVVFSRRLQKNKQFIIIGGSCPNKFVAGPPLPHPMPWYAYCLIYFLFVDFNLEWSQFLTHGGGGVKNKSIKQNVGWGCFCQNKKSHFMSWCFFPGPVLFYFQNFRRQTLLGVGGGGCFGQK